MHTPVLLEESLEYLGIKPDGVYLDATCGLGGHTGAIARRLISGVVIACDRDAESLELARTNTVDCASRIRFHKTLFSQLGETLAAEGISQLDGLLADLGSSRYQLTSRERGFSFSAGGPLDMRHDRSQQLTAADIVNYESEKEIADLIYELGEERGSRRIARAIVRARPITTTDQLAKLIEGVVPRTGKIHPATKSFMALRIATNKELEELDALLESLPRLVKPGGRVVVITFMSLEDRKVKRAFQAMARDGRAAVLTKHVIRPARTEVLSNPAARSSMLRALEITEPRP
jgi:16S rRNA (cytosine1402-N4)-methyltransferase